MGPLDDGDAALHVHRLPLLVEGHDHDRGAEAQRLAGAFAELLLALLERQRVDDGTALELLEPGDDGLEAAGVDHDRQPRHLGVGGDQAQEAPHRLRAIQHALVHTHVERLGAVLGLVTGHRQRFFVAVLADQPCEAPRPGHVAALSDVDEVGVRTDLEFLQPGEAGQRGPPLAATRRHPRHRFGQGADVVRRGPATTADQVHQSRARPLADVFGHGLRAEHVVAELVGKPGVRIGQDEGLADAVQLLQMGPHLGRAERAVEARGERPTVAHRGPERGQGLPAQGAPAGIGDGAADHQRHLGHALRTRFQHSVDGGLGVEHVEDGLDEEDVHTALDQGPGLLLVGRDQIAEVHVARRGIGDVRRHGGHAVGRADGPRDPAGS